MMTTSTRSSLCVAPGIIPGNQRRLMDPHLFARALRLCDAQRLEFGRFLLQLNGSSLQYGVQIVSPQVHRSAAGLSFLGSRRQNSTVSVRGRILDQSGSRAMSSTSSIVLTMWNVISSRLVSGSSSRSASFLNGRITSVSPARCAARTFCLTPPIGNTLP